MSTKEDRLIQLVWRIEDYVQSLGSRVMYGTEPEARQLEADLLAELNHPMDGDSGPTWMRSHRAAMMLIAQLIRYNIVGRDPSDDY